MSLHKIRPQFKKYSKTKLFLKHDQPTSLIRSKKALLKMFSPDVHYLNPKWVNKLERHFKNRLDERRKLKFFFGFYRTALLKKILKNEYKKKKKLRQSLKSLEFCSILERRLDILLCRLGFVSTIYEAKQLISHKKVKVNNYSNSSFSRLLKKGDIISFDYSVQSTIQKNLLKHLKVSNTFLNNSNQIEVNFKTLRIVVLTNKINLFSQIPQYQFNLRWNNIIDG